jgi:hypothetical protein
MKKFFSITGLGTTIFVTFLFVFFKEAIESFSQQIKSGVANVGVALINMYYKQCASASLNVFITSIILFIAFCFLIVFITDGIIRITKKIVNKVKSKDESLNIPLVPIQPDKLNYDESVQIENASTELDDIDSQLEGKITGLENYVNSISRLDNINSQLKDIKTELENYEKSHSKNKILKTISVFEMIFICAYIVIYITMPIIHKTAFDMKMTQVTPYISSSEINQLKSDWVSMRSYEDYKLINDRIHEVRNENDLPSIYIGFLK